MNEAGTFLELLATESNSKPVTETDQVESELIEVFISLEYFFKS